MFKYKKFSRKLFAALAIQLALVACLGAMPAVSAAANSVPDAHQSEINTGGLPNVDANDNNLENILQVAFGILGAFALLSITLSGFKYVTSAGNTQKAAEARSGVGYALIGLVIAIFAEALITYIATQLS